MRLEGTDPQRNAHDYWATGEAPFPVGSPAGSAAPRVLGFLLVVFALVLAYEWWLLNSSSAREARDRLMSEARIGSEFGHIRMPLMAGWTLNGEATLLVFVNGTEAAGIAYFRMTKRGQTWAVTHLEARNWSEDHLLNLSPVTVEAKASQLRGVGRLYVVALGNSASQEAAALVKLFQEDFNVPAQMLPVMEVPTVGRDPKRKQWIAEMLVGAMAARFPDIVSDPDARVVGIIDDDMYIRAFDWPLAYSYRYLKKYAVLPTARLNPSFYGHKPSDAIKDERLRKIALKCLGIMYFGFGENEDPDSLMSFEATIRDVDYQSEHYLANDLMTQAQLDDHEGTPCLNLSSVNVAGVPPLRPIGPCSEPYDLSKKSFYQVDLTQGEFRAGRNDLYGNGPLRLYLLRKQFSHLYDGKARAFGKSTWHNLDDTVWSVDAQSIQTINIYGVDFKRVTPGAGFSPDARYVAPERVGDFSGAWLTWEGNWRISTRGGEVWHYLGCSPTSSIPCYFMNRTDRHGDRVAVERDQQGYIKTVTQEAVDLPDFPERTWTFTHEGPLVRAITDSGGGFARYSYNHDDYLSDVETDEHHLHYDYDEGHRIIRSIEDGAELGVHYDSEGRAYELIVGNDVAYTIQYGGENVVVKGPTGKHTVNLRGTYFRIAHEP